MRKLITEAVPSRQHKDLHPCFICDRVRLSPDEKPPWRCHECYAAVAMNEADGEL